MQNPLYQEIRQTKYFVPYLVTSILFIALGVILTIKIGFPDIEAHLDYASFVIGLGTMTLFSYSLEGDSFVKIRDDSAKLALMFLIVTSFNMVFINSGENYFGKGHVIFPTCYSLAIYLVAFLVKVYIKPYNSKE